MGDAPGLSHRAFVELVTEYLEGGLTPADRARFERHLADCPECDAYFAQMRVTIRVLGRLSAEALPPEAWQLLLQAFHDWRRERS